MDTTYTCDDCNYSTNNNSNYNKHIKNKKHLKSINLQNAKLRRYIGDKWRGSPKNCIKKGFVCG